MRSVILRELGTRGLLRSKLTRFFFLSSFSLGCDSVVIDDLQCLREFEMIKFVSQMALSVVQELSTATFRAHGCR